MNEQKNEYLLNLLSFDQCHTVAEVRCRARAIAEELIFNWEIVTKKATRRFLGIEFYIYIPRILEDCAVHCRPEQLDSGTFYFHTKCKNTDEWTPLGFKRQGLDITCGNKRFGIYGGILLRHLSGENHRDGPSISIRSLIRGDDGFKSVPHSAKHSGWSQDEIDFFNRNNGRSIFGEELCLRYAPIVKDLEVIERKRIGLKNKLYFDLETGFFVKEK